MGLRGGMMGSGDAREQLVPFAAAHAAVVARKRLDRDDPAGAVTAIWLGTRGARRVGGDVRYLLAEAVVARPRLLRLALSVAIGGGTTWQRLEAAVVVLGAALGLWQTRSSIPAVACAGGQPRYVGQRGETFWLSDR